MAKKILNNKVEFVAGGKSVIVKLSDFELKELREYSDYKKGEDLSKMTMAKINNFGLHAFTRYTLKNSSKAGRICATFPYHDYDYVMWVLNN